MAEDNGYVSHHECGLECRRLEAEDKRQNERIDRLECRVDHLTDLTVSVKELTVEVKNMGNKVDTQSDRIQALEGRDGEKYRDIWKIIVTAAIGIGLGALAMFIGLK